MTYEIVSRESWNVLGTFGNEAAAREATRVSLANRGATVGNIVVYVSPERGRARELSGGTLASWVGIHSPHAQDPRA